MELVERLGHTFDWWLLQPLAFLYWCYYHLQEIDRRRQWAAKADRINLAWLDAKAFHDPDALKSEERAHIASASGEDSDTAAIERGRAMLTEFERGQTLEGLIYRGAN